MGFQEEFAEFATIFEPHAVVQLYRTIGVVNGKYLFTFFLEVIARCLVQHLCISAAAVFCIGDDICDDAHTADFGTGT